MKAPLYPAHRAKQRGVALLIALVILAIAAALATNMIWNRELDIRRTANIIHGDQAMEYALGAEAWAEQILQRDFQQNPQITDLTQDWAMQLPPLPVQGGSITGRLQDLQGLFNVNNLASTSAPQAAAALQQFQRLLMALNIDPAIANAVADWVNAGTQPHVPDGAGDEFYSRLTPPYLTAERPMSDISELLLVKDVTPAIYAQLLPYVCALPLQPPGSVPGMAMTPTALNINTAPAVVLMSLNTGISAEAAAVAVHTRSQHPFQSAQDLTQLLQGITTAAGILPSLTSDYFRLTAQVRIGSTQITLYSLLYRNQTGGTIAIQRTFGTL